MAVLRSTGEPGKASPIRGGGHTEKRTRRREPGKTVAVWSSVSQRAWSATILMISVRCLRSVASLTTARSLSRTSTRFIAALLGQPGDASAGSAQLLAIGDLEASHGRPALLGVVRCGGTVFAFELGEI